MIQSAISNKTSQALKITWLSKASEIPEQIWQECFAPNLEGRFWYQIMDDSGLEDQFQFFYGLLLQDEKPIGIVPAFLNDVPIELVAPNAIAAGLRVLSKIIPTCGYQRTLFIGSPCADEGTMGLLTELRLQDFVQFIHQEVLNKAVQLNAPMIVWKDFPQTDEAALDTLCKDGTVFKMHSYPAQPYF